ncbi:MULTISPECIES: suppressor of fused domain protein [Actinopolyspora]|uniref:Suppressor of fused protein (SUFU) n=1 Tax=Actinopolyspora saharensis TaxID=995062 RepID=A0A1H1EWK4_9ACTN|nr:MULTISPECIES: suppressor of fused domain protein [Actinopolyspora]NHD18260.1 suppressor of fused domain protein [Actinopolyspora sp. BKK2]NHE77061.1 suppressor of fused domain protein [Actinopolyspora sp. BKK1]SDQ93102.1 Suppressor of fused protein (SUFU) [Actinopolyspora saharensis]
MSTDNKETPPIGGAHRFVGLAENLERYAGRPSEAEPPNVNGPDRGYGLVFFHLDEYHLTSVISSGLRFQPIGAEPAQELACTVYREQAEAARYLVDISSELLVRNSTHLVPDQLVPNNQPLLAGTEFHALLAGGHPMFPPEFTRFTDAQGVEQLQVFTLLPVTLGELNFALDRGVSALRKQWARFEVDVFDLGRPSVA